MTLFSLTIFLDHSFSFPLLMTLFSGGLLMHVYMSFQDLVILNLSGKFCKLLTLFHTKKWIFLVFKIVPANCK
jgi:hypothetical protein